MLGGSSVVCSVIEELRRRPLRHIGRKTFNFSLTQGMYCRFEIRTTCLCYFIKECFNNLSKTVRISLKSQREKHTIQLVVFMRLFFLVYYAKINSCCPWCRASAGSVLTAVGRRTRTHESPHCFHCYVLLVCFGAYYFDGAPRPPSATVW